MTSYEGNDIQWSHVLSREWRCSWSSTDRRCSNYIKLVLILGYSWGSRDRVFFAFVGQRNVINQLECIYSWLSMQRVQDRRFQMHTFLVNNSFSLGVPYMRQQYKPTFISVLIPAWFLPDAADMMTSSNGNIFCVTDPLWGEFTDDLCEGNSSVTGEFP